MSKPFSNLFAPALTLTAALCLLLVPGGLMLPEPSDLIRTVLVPLLFLVMANLLCRLGSLPRPAIALLLLTTLIPPFILLETLHHPLYVLLSLMPLALMGLHLAPQLFPQQPWMMFPIMVLPLIARTVAPLKALHSVSPDSLPTLVYNQDMMILAALVVPASLALRPFLRPFARALLKAELLLLALPFIIAPFIWAGLTSLKEPGESLQDPNVWMPKPRLHLETETFTLSSLLPDEWEDEADQEQLVLAWYETARLLSDPSMRSAFQGPDMPLPPKEMLRALQIYDFIQRDRDGYFVPEETFFRDPPPKMDPSAAQWIERLRLHAAMTPRRLSVRLTISQDQALLLLRRLQRLKLARRIPGEEDRFRPTAEARKPLENGWHLRQLQLLITTPSGSWLPRKEYAKAWGLSSNEHGDELTFLLERGYLQPQPGIWHPSNFEQVATQSALYRDSLLHLAALITALGAACLLHLPHKGLPTWCGFLILLILPYPGSTLLWIPLRFGVGIYLLRAILVQEPGLRNALILFATATAVLSSLLPLLPASQPLEIRTAWVLIVLPLPLVLMGLSVFAYRLPKVKDDLSAETL